MRMTILYVAAVVAVNWGFSVVPLIPIGGGEMWPPLSLVVGGILVLRDFAQREIGHKVWLAMLVGAVLSYLFADPFIAIASASAFIVAEAFDWAVFTFTKKPLAQRVLLSSVASAPIDSAVFLLFAGFFGWWGFVAMTVSKLLAAGVVWFLMKSRS